MEHESATPQWDVLTAELRAYRDQQKQTWGDVDSALMGRYLAGEATTEERSRVEASFDQHPDLRILADLVRDVLGECQPVPSQTSVQQAEPEVTHPRLLPFTKQPKVRHPFLVRLRRNGALAAAACLLLALGVTLGSQPLPSADTVASNGWEDFKANRDGDRNDQFFSRDANSAERRAPRAGERAMKQDSPPSRSLELLATNLEKARERRSHDSIKEVALGVESYLAKASPETYAHTSFHSVPSPVAPDPVPGGGLGAAGTTVRSFAAKDAPGPQPERVLADAAVVLTRGLEQDDRPELQQQCCEALARMGPVAVPALEDTLKRARSPRQQQVVVHVLKQMGPVAQRAAPTLAWVADKGLEKAVRGQAEEALRFVDLPCGSAGVNDVDRVLADQSRRHLNQRIQAVCRKHHVCFVAETVRCLPDDTAKIIPVVDGTRREQVVARWAEVRRRQVGAEDGVYFLICQDPPAVHVALGKDVKAKVPLRLTEQSLSGLLRTHLQDKDKGLEKAVRLVEHELSRAR
ncbi:MAG: HEAT repeat domain-containing protein [Planctomycetes bacterium]|nr:HEAT repeat domain-containing protein [Planctomycetota bacterium]